MTKECTQCRKKLGIHHYVPKGKWNKRFNVKEPLCSQCWDKLDTIYESNKKQEIKS